MTRNPKLITQNLLLKIGIVCYPSIGGSGIVATNLGLELAKLGHEVHFISYDSPFKLIQKSSKVFFHKVNINEYDLFKYPDYTLPLAVAIEKVQKKFNLDILHVHYAVPHATAALLGSGIMQSNNIKLPKIITTLHGTDITLFAKDKNLFEVIKYSIERSHGVTTVSESLKKDTVKILKTQKNIQVIHNFFTPSPVTKSSSQIRKLLKLKPDDFIAIHLSNLRAVKRIPDLLKIASLIKNPKFKLLILSGGNFSSYQPLVKKLKLNKKIVVLKNIKNVGNYINASDIGLYTSETESFGMGILETMSYGKPVLATKVGGIPEVVDQNKTGYLFKIGDVKSFAFQINHMMANKNLTSDMGVRAKQKAENEFCSSVIVPKYIEYYKSALN